MEFKYLTTKQKNPKPTASFVKWRMPPVGYKLNTDRAMFKDTKISGIRGVIKDYKDNWIINCMGNSFQGGNRTTELCVLCRGLQFAVDLQLTPLEISVYCQNFLFMLTQDHPTYSSILHDYRGFLLRLGNPPVRHDYRKINQVTDLLSEEGARLMEPNSFLQWADHPLFVEKKLEAYKVDKLFLLGLKKPHMLNIESYFVIPPSNDSTSSYQAVTDLY